MTSEIDLLGTGAGKIIEASLFWCSMGRSS